MWPREDGNYWTWSLNEQEVVLTAATSKPEGVSDHSEAQRRTQTFSSVAPINPFVHPARAHKSLYCRSRAFWYSQQVT